MWLQGDAHDADRITRCKAGGGHPLGQALIRTFGVALRLRRPSASCPFIVSPGFDGGAEGAKWKAERGIEEASMGQL